MSVHDGPNSFRYLCPEIGLFGPKSAGSFLALSWVGSDHRARVSMLTSVHIKIFTQKLLFTCNSSFYFAVLIHIHIDYRSIPLTFIHLRSDSLVFNWREMVKDNDAASSMDIDIEKSNVSDQPKFSINGNSFFLFVFFFMIIIVVVFDFLIQFSFDFVSFAVVEICSNAAWTSSWRLHSL